MPVSLEQKKALVANIHNLASNSVSAVTADYRGLTVSEMDELRVNARKVGVSLQVVRNSLARRAVEGTDFACLEDSFVGPILLAFSKEEPSAAARVFRDFAKDHELLEVKALSISGQLLDSSDLDKVASLPTKEEAIAQLMSVMIAPVTKLVRTTAETYAIFVRALAAVGDKKQQG